MIEDIILMGYYRSAGNRLSC